MVRFFEFSVMVVQCGYGWMFRNKRAALFKNKLYLQGFCASVCVDV